MSRKGIGATAISDITEAADVGLGTFYNHFESKEQIAQLAFAERAEQLALEFNAIFDRVDDPVLAASYVQRWFVERAVREPPWGWFLLHAESAFQIFDATFRGRIRSDLQRSVSAGRFQIPGLESAVTITLAAIVANIRLRLEAKEPPSATRDMVENLMRMYGLQHAAAGAVAREPFPPWLGTVDDL